MKKIIILLALSMIALGSTAQGILSPIKSRDIFKIKDKLTQVTTTTIPSAWTLSFGVIITADELTLNNQTWVSNPLSSTGVAIKYSHFIQLPDGTPYEQYGIGFAVMGGYGTFVQSPSSFKMAVIVNVLKYIAVGLDYSLPSGKVGLLTGANITF